MDKDNYNIDSILSEVKKRREQQEAEIRAAKAKEQAEKSPNPRVEDIEPKPAPVIEEKPKPAPKPEPKIEKKPEPKVEPKVEEKAEEKPKPAPKAKEAPKAKDENEQVKAGFNLSALADDDDIDEDVEKINTDTEYPEEIEDKPKKKKKISAQKVRSLILCAIIALLIAVVAAGAYFYFAIWRPLQEVTPDESQVETVEKWDGMDKLVENFDPITEPEADEISSLKDMMRQWYYNGSPCSSSHVLNVLLVGEDTRGAEILDDETRADAAIIASINIDTQTITLTSILRDTYAYWETEPGDETTGQFGKINGAMSTGDINSYINCVERLYKIDIDDYVIVNFDSFEEIVDVLGGVTLKLTDDEINEINNHQKRYGKVKIEKTFEGESGKMKLNGKQALAYCRIRKLDSDNARADRQKTCLMKIFKQAKGASKTKLIRLIRTMIPYVNTSCSDKKIVKIATYALSEGWLDYDVQMLNVPYSRIDEDAAGGIFYGAWYWKSDFPQDAYNVQYLLYGKSSITLAHERVDVLRCPEDGFFKETQVPVYSTITNNSYGEVTVFELPTKESTTKAN